MEKLRKAMRKEDGFTLVELLAVIVILGIILAIAIPAIGNVIQNSRDKAAEQEKALVLDAARLYLVGEDKTVPTGDTGLEIDIETELIGRGYLENADKLTGTVTVTKGTNGNLIYEYGGTTLDEAGDEAGDEG